MVESLLRSERIQMRDRYLFAALPLPPGLAATKNVDWSAFRRRGEEAGREGQERRLGSHQDVPIQVFGQEKAGHEEAGQEKSQ